jgi:DUF4097 and DUF4098 domain-containing protein YvlB
VVSIAGDHTEDWELGQLGDVISLRPGWGWRSRSARVLVDAPTGTTIDVRTASADVSLTGSFGRVRVRSVSGDLRAQEVGELDATTASGDVSVDRVTADATASTVSGDIVCGAVAGRIVANTASGDLRVRQVGGDVRVGTTSGDVRIECCDGSDIAVKCVSGNVELGLPTGIRVEPDVSTMSGRVRTPTPAPVTTPAGGRRLVHVNLRSVSGDITIDRAG